MKVLWVGDAACSSGFARCTHAACDALHAAGHEVEVLGINYYGDPHGWPYRIWPCVQPLDGGRDPFGVSRLPLMVSSLRPDVVVLLNDPWNVPAYLQALESIPGGAPDPAVVAWLAVDACNQDGEPLNKLSHVMVWTEFAEAELWAGGYRGPSTVVPLGVDHGVFRPRDRSEARARVLPDVVPRDAFIVGVVGRNQPRKRLDLTIAYFADLYEKAPEARLLMHIAPTGDRGVDLQRLVRYYRLDNKVILSEPHISRGLPDETMSWVYAAMDVYLTTTQGEGWGLPALEAMACGLPCVVPRWSGLGDWAAEAAVQIPCSSTAVSAPLNSRAYTIGGVADRARCVASLRELRDSPELRAQAGRDCFKLAAEFSWKRTGGEMLEALEKVACLAQKPQAATGKGAASGVARSAEIQALGGRQQASQAEGGA